MMSGESAKLTIQAMYFILIARNLGPNQYGTFVAVSATAAIVSPFVGNGSDSLMIKNVSRNRSSFRFYWGNTLLISSVLGVLLSLVVILACRACLPHSLSLLVILELVVAEAVFGRMVDVSAKAFQAVELLKWTASINVLAALMRLAGIVAILVLHRPTLKAWSAAYLTTAAISATAALVCVLMKLGRPTPAVRLIPKELLEGLYFSIGLSAQTIYNDIDKSMLARLGSLNATGIYAAAYRLIDVSFVPVKSLLAAAYPTFFRSGQAGIRGSVEFAQRLLRKPLLYSATIASAMLVAAPLVPLVLGAQYAQTVEALRWLSILPILKTLHYFAADSLTGAGMQGLRTLMQTIVAVFNVLANFWIIPRASWRGAAWSSLASDGLLAAILWGCALFLRARKQARPAPSEQVYGVPEAEGVSS
jgi:O-antigen/teichoic acid export membrane protein